MLKERLASTCAGIILNEIRTSGRLTMISDECGINRKFFNRKGFRLLRFHRLVNLLYSLSSWQSREDFTHLGSRLFGAIWDFCSLYDDEYYEHRRRGVPLHDEWTALFPAKRPDSLYRTGEEW